MDVPTIPVFVVESFITGLPIEVTSELDVRLCRNIEQTEKLLLELANDIEKIMNAENTRIDPG